MKNPRRTSQFHKDVKLAIKRGKNPKKLEYVLSELIDGASLSPKYRDHSLKGSYIGHRECHIESDWLLIYKLPPESPNEIIFVRCGTHADLF